MKHSGTFLRRRWKDWMEAEQQGSLTLIGNRDLLQTTASDCSFGSLSCPSVLTCILNPSWDWNNTKIREQKRLPKQFIVLVPNHLLQKGRTGAAVPPHSQSGCCGCTGSDPPNLLTQITLELPPDFLTSTKVTFLEIILQD